MRKYILLFMVFACSVSCVYPQAKKFSNFSGSSFSAQEIDGAPKTILFMWTTWCPYCRKEFSRLMKDPVNVEGVSFFFVNLGESRSKIDDYLKGIKAPDSIKEKVILDENEYFATKFQVVGIPTYIFLKNGAVINQENFLKVDAIKDIFDKAQ